MPKTIHARPAFLLGASLALSPLLLGALVLWHPEWNQFGWGALFLCLYMLSLYVICCPRMVLDSGILIYKTAFASRRVPVSQITALRASATPVPTLNIVIDDGGGDTASLELAISPFRSRDICHLFSAICVSCPEVSRTLHVSDAA